jgi:hypothetical protein
METKFPGAFTGDRECLFVQSEREIPCVMRLCRSSPLFVIPAFAGMTKRGECVEIRIPKNSFETIYPTL